MCLIRIFDFPFYSRLLLIYFDIDPFFPQPRKNKQKKIVSFPVSLFFSLLLLLTVDLKQNALYILSSWFST